MKIGRLNDQGALAAVLGATEPLPGELLLDELEDRMIERWLVAIGHGQVPSIERA
jgi:hypothetical protein